MLHYSQTGRKQSWTGRPVLQYDKLLDFLFVHSSTNMTKQTNHWLLPIHGSTHNTPMKSSRSTIAELYFSRRVFYILFSHFCSIMGIWGLGFWGWGLGLGFWVRGFQLMWFGPVLRGHLDSLGLGSLYKHRRISLGKKLCLMRSSRSGIADSTNH